MNAHADTTIPIRDIYRLRLKPFVEQRIAKSKHNTFLRKHPQEKWLAHIQAEMLEYLSLERFITMTDDELRKLVGKQMSLELVAGMLNDLTPEQMATFNECLAACRRIQLSYCF